MAETGDTEPCRSAGASAWCTSQGPAFSRVFRGTEILNRRLRGGRYISIYYTFIVQSLLPPPQAGRGDVLAVFVCFLAK